MQNVSGGVAVITGAGSGIGPALALSIARQRCHLAFADADKTALSATVAPLDSI